MITSINQCQIFLQFLKNVKKIKNIKVIFLIEIKIMKKKAFQYKKNQKTEIKNTLIDKIIQLLTINVALLHQ